MELPGLGWRTWHYGYNGRGEVTSGTKKITNTSVPGYSFGYQFDGIGNRESATTNGVTDVYSPNELNQYAQRTVPAYFQVRGQAKAIPVASPGTPIEPEGVAVKLEGPQSPYTEAAYNPLQSDYYGLALPVPAPGNQDNALWKGITIEAWANNATNEYKVTETRKDFLPKSPEDYDYDDDGNLIKDGRWTYQWDGENRLIRMVARTADFPGGTLPVGMEVGKLEFQYDWMGRRTTKRVYGPNGTTQLRSTAFLYDGWALMFEVERHLTGTLEGHVVTREYAWGPDVSGEPGGAGGVGGLQRTEIVDYDLINGITISEGWIPAYDGNGNIVAYLDRASGDIVQEEEYGPFGEALRSRSTALLRSPIGWSTKYTDEETGLVYYGYRYYAPQVGRWVNRDPIEEDGGNHLYGFVDNQSTALWDVLGLDFLHFDGSSVVHYSGKGYQKNDKGEESIDWGDEKQKWSAESGGTNDKASLPKGWYRTLGLKPLGDKEASGLIGNRSEKSFWEKGIYYQGTMAAWEQSGYKDRNNAYPNVGPIPSFDPKDESDKAIGMPKNVEFKVGLEGTHGNAVPYPKGFRIHPMDRTSTSGCIGIKGYKQSVSFLEFIKGQKTMDLYVGPRTAGGCF